MNNIMEKEELAQILELHKKWLADDPNGIRANLRWADLRWASLSGADLSRADLRGASLSGADLRWADLRGASLSGADLRWADLRWADLRGADLSRADLRGASLSGADLSRADLRGASLSGADLSRAGLSKADLYGADLSIADLSGADLRGANLSGVKANANTAFFALQCPESGSYIGYKKVGGLIVELEIPADAQRSSATSRKCRASKAKVLSITTIEGTPAGDSVASDYDRNFVYTVGQTAVVDNFCTDRWNECAPGIHHFITRGEAVAYR